MHIIIPMSGFGERFKKVGYTIPKPLINVDGRPIISHVIDMFPKENNFTFICNREHLNNSSYKMEEIILNYCKKAKIIPIKPHKLGPVHAVTQVRNYINLTEPTIVNYCDFTCYWDWKNFKNAVLKSKVKGAIPAYRGFHPHSLGTTNYAYIKEENGFLIDIQEKRPFTENKMNEFASSGTYYFSTGKLMLDAFDEQIKNKLIVGNEYYVSLAYKTSVLEKQKVLIYPLQHFMQWGTPEDLNEYDYWSKMFRKLLLKQDKNLESGSIILPMAGLGQRYINEGYKKTKPLIPVSGSPMVLQAINDLPNVSKHAFILRRDMQGYREIKNKLEKNYPNCLIKTLKKTTSGQAITALLGVNDFLKLNNNIDPITIGTCDNGIIYDGKKLRKLLNNKNVDIIVWGIRGYPNAAKYPNMYGWLECKNKIINKASVKKKIKSVKHDPIIIGTFTFKNGLNFVKIVNNLFEKKLTVNGEYYIDSCINEAIDIGLNCYYFEVESYLCWGTPNDLRTFEYWQSCFHKWGTHPYSLEDDSRVSKNQLKSLKSRYSKFNNNLIEINNG